MITDVLFKRYPESIHFPFDFPYEVSVCLRQIASVIFDDLSPHIGGPEKACSLAYSKFIRELGYQIGLSNFPHPGRKTDAMICGQALSEDYDIRNHSHGSGEDYFLHRLSLAELILAEMEKLWPTNGKSLEVWKSGVAEINTRLRSVRSTYLPFHYHNGIFQLAEDSLSQEVIHEPFWEILHHPKWKNVDADMKEAIDRRDSGKRDAVL
ncbi:MAG: hypothetical protein KDM63_12215, partial [Verrucomicrobiae bacterium]|nr:hypothetical protein [Verrucomicrobiae bacterium]